jgi:hypothetical protein
MLASCERRETSVALTSTLHWFEGLGRLNAELVQRAATGTGA